MQYKFKIAFVKKNANKKLLKSEKIEFANKFKTSMLIPYNGKISIKVTIYKYDEI
jgi:hypothetical protein